MSHHLERKDKNCLNCNTLVAGRYCQKCGQENIEPKESFWQLITHFFNDVTHFDGKFFTSIKVLLFKPGFLSAEYVAGKRMRYLNPIRIYLFTSAIFFLVFFSTIGDVGSNIDFQSNEEVIMKMDSAQFQKFIKTINNGDPLTKEEYLEAKIKNEFNIGPSRYKNRKTYDSLLRTGAVKHNWLEKQLVFKNIQLHEKYPNSNEIKKELVNRFVHTLPQMLFVLLPLFALVLKLLFIRRKKFYYVDHIIFTIHLYIFIFLVLLLRIGINKLADLLKWEWLSYLTLVLLLLVFFYFYKALRRFYMQRRAKTIFKYFILLLLFTFITLLLFIAVLFFSIFST